MAALFSALQQKEKKTIQLYLKKMSDVTGYPSHYPDYENDSCSLFFMKNPLFFEIFECSIGTFILHAYGEHLHKLLLHGFFFPCSTSSIPTYLFF